MTSHIKQLPPIKLKKPMKTTKNTQLLLDLDINVENYKDFHQCKNHFLSVYYYRIHNQPIGKEWFINNPEEAKQCSKCQEIINSSLLESKVAKYNCKINYTNHDNDKNPRGCVHITSKQNKLNFKFPKDWRSCADCRMFVEGNVVRGVLNPDELAYV